jgi:hypothetical protein
MSESLSAERRKSSRVEATLNINLHLDLPGDQERAEELETINVSSSGVYFRSESFIEPMTKLALSFDVPVEAKDARATAPVRCEGIVARVVPELPSDDVDIYEIAVFFTTIDADSLHNLERYIALRLTP